MRPGTFSQEADGQSFNLYLVYSQKRSHDSRNGVLGRQLQGVNTSQDLILQENQKVYYIVALCLRP